MEPKSCDDPIDSPLNILLLKNASKNHEEKITDTSSDKKESLLDLENYNEYVKLEKKNKIIQSIKASKKCFSCSFPGCKKKYSAPYNMKIHYRSHVGEKPYKCPYSKCDRSFYDQGNLKYHISTHHKGEKKKIQFKCEHAECKLNFKTKKQKLNHHNKLEKECFSERNALIKLAARYKTLYFGVINEFKLNEKVQNQGFHLGLNREFEERLETCYDHSFFVAKMGETFVPEGIIILENSIMKQYV